MKQISICMPVYNSEKFIDLVVQSIINQDFTNWELLIVDDNSTDKSLSKLLNYAHADSRIKIFSNTKKGAASARNLAFSHAVGKFIIFLDSDDYLPNYFLNSQINSIQNENNVVVSKWGRFYSGDLASFQLNKSDHEGDLSFHQWILFYWDKCIHTTPPGRVFIPKHLIEKAGNWDEDLTLNDDFAFFSRVFSEAKIIQFNPNAVFYYNSGVNGLSSSKSSRAYWSSFFSTVRSCDVALLKYGKDEQIKKACANLFQNLIYELYPKEKEIIKACTEKINQLGGSDFAFPAGGYSKNLAPILGWKATKRLQKIAHHFRKTSSFR